MHVGMTQLACLEVGDASQHSCSSWRTIPSRYHYKQPRQVGGMNFHCGMAPRLAAPSCIRSALRVAGIRVFGPGARPPPVRVTAAACVRCRYILAHDPVWDSPEDAAIHRSLYSNNTMSQKLNVALLGAGIFATEGESDEKMR